MYQLTLRNNVIATGSKDYCLGFRAATLLRYPGFPVDQYDIKKVEA